MKDNEFIQKALVLSDQTVGELVTMVARLGQPYRSNIQALIDAHKALADAYDPGHQFRDHACVRGERVQGVDCPECEKS